MTWTLKQHAFAGGANGGTTTAADFTGVDLLVVYVSHATVTPTDSIGTNTYISAVSENVIAGVAIWYVQAPNVNSSMTFSISQASTFSTVAVQGWSGSSASPLDQTNHGNSSPTSVTSFQAGSVTPSVSNELIVAGAYLDSASASIAIDSSFTISDSGVLIGGTEYAFGMAYLAPGSVTVNPTWSWTTSTMVAGVIATFKGAVAAATVHNLPLLGFGQMLGWRATLPIAVAWKIGSMIRPETSITRRSLLTGKRRFPDA